MIESIPPDWLDALGGRLGSIDLPGIDRFVAGERALHDVYPPAGLEFEALRLTPFANVRAVLLGQDPYHEQGQAHGLAFSTLAEKRPRSLENIFAEWQANFPGEMPAGGSLEPWARHGVLLLNTALTVLGGEAHNPSHAKIWRDLTRAVVETVDANRGPIAFLLWGRSAIKSGAGIDRGRHVVIESSHPSPCSAKRWCGAARPFFGSRPFAAANCSLVQMGAEQIDWSLDRSTHVWFAACSTRVI